MKSASALAHVLGFILTSSCLLAQDIDDIKKPIEEREAFGTFFGLLPYSDTFGLALWNTAPLYEARTKTLLTHPVEKREKQLMEKAKDMLANQDVQFFYDYAKMGADTTLQFENNQGNAVLLRVRKDFEMLNEGSSEAEFMWMDDRKLDDSGTMIDATVMLDFYLDPFYGKTGSALWKRNRFWIERPYQFWFRTGVSVEQNDLPGVSEVDQRKWYGLVTFQANPDQQARLFGIDGWEITSPQIVQLGATYEENILTGDSAWSWLVGWAPVFKLNQSLLKGLGLNKRMYFSDDPAENNMSAEVIGASDQKQNIVREPKPNLGWYVSVNPIFNIAGESTARGLVKQLKGVKSRTDLEGLQDEQFKWDLTNMSEIIG